MSLATSNRDGGRTSESGHLRAIQKVITGEVLTGLNVSQRSAGANMSVDVAIGDAIIPRADGTYGHPAWNDAVYNQVIGTADVSNPRRDIVVMYIDYSVTPSTGVSNNTNGVVKISVVAGTPAGSPVDPSDASIQSAVGASNPYIKLARVRVAAAASSITNSVIDDLRLMATGVEQGGWIYDDIYTWTYASSTSFTVAGVDVTSQFPTGTKIALYQSGSIKYFVVVSSAFSTNTTITVNGLGTYTLTNVPIDRAAYSYMLTPQGFPVGPTFNPYKFSAIGSAGSTAIATGAYTKFPFDTKVFDTGTNYNTTNRQFVAPVAGFYQFSAGIRIDAAGSGALYKMILSKNGTGANTVEGNAVTSSGAAQVRLEVSGLMQLAAGDTIEVDYYGSHAGNMFPNGSHFSGYLVSIV
jgi:hypothetical protein